MPRKICPAFSTSPPIRVSSFWKRIEAASRERASSASRCARCFLSPERPQTLREGSTLPASKSQASSFGTVSVVGSLAIQNLSHATLSWARTSTVGTVSIASLRSDLVTFHPSTGRQDRNHQQICKQLCRPRCVLSREFWRTFLSSTRLPVSSIVRSLAISGWSAQNSRLGRTIGTECSQAYCGVAKSGTRKRFCMDRLIRGLANRAGRSH
jgi:hypothetical protein